MSYTAPVLLEFLLSQFDSSHDACPHLDPEQLDKNGDCLFHLIARAKFSTYVLKLTEMLCSKNLSANYYNKEGKLPINYIIKTNDRRLQYLRLASSVAPSREQLHGPNVPVKEESTASLDEDLTQIQGPSSDSVTNQKVVIEVTRTVSIRETRKKHIEELIRLLPDSKHSIFKVDQSPSSNIVIASENKDSHSGEDNMDENSQKTKAYAKNSDAGASDRSYLDSQSNKTDTESSKTFVQESKNIEEMTGELAHTKIISQPFTKGKEIGDKTDSISSKLKQFNVKDVERENVDTITNTRLPSFETDMMKVEKDNLESIEEYADAFNELNSSVNTTEDFDEHVRHEKSNDSSGQKDSTNYNKSSKITEENNDEPINVEIMGKAKVIEDVKEEDTEQIKTVIREKTGAFEDLLKVNKELVDNDNVLLDKMNHEEESLVESDEEDEEEEIEDDYEIDVQVSVIFVVFNEFIVNPIPV